MKPVDPRDPRERARRRLSALQKGALLLVSAAVGPANAGCDVLPSPPPGGFPTPACATSEDVSNWLFATVTSSDPILMTLSLNAGESNLGLATVFNVTGGTLAQQPSFDGASLALSKNVTLRITPNEGATSISIDTGVTCGEDARAVRFTFTIDELNANGSAFPLAEDVSPP